MDKLGINLGYLITQILGITALITLLAAFVYKPMIRALEERKAKIAKGLEDARQAEIARENADQEAKKIMDEARAEAANIRREATVQAEESSKAIEAKAREEAKAIVAKAGEDAVEERNHILADLRSQVAAISVAAAYKMVGVSLDEKRQHELITDFFSAVPAEVKSMSGEKAIVTSALPLTDSEKANVKKMMDVKEIDYKVDPSILGGLIIQVGDRIIDDSVSNRMGALEESLR
ncbi:MAG: F0F1 ATP synthase subunit B [Chloroflexota bacterium]